jgi:hypothetical protein
MNVVDQYKFGEIIVSGHSFHNDIIILPDIVYSDWWRREGHNLCREDLAQLLGKPLDLLIIGTGFNDRMKVPTELIKELESFGISVIVKDSNNAVELYNRRLQEKKNLALAIHLTC